MNENESIERTLDDLVIALTEEAHWLAHSEPTAFVCVGFLDSLRFIWLRARFKFLALKLCPMQLNGAK
jgi:hypothetical protein